MKRDPGNKSRRREARRAGNGRTCLSGQHDPAVSPCLRMGGGVRDTPRAFARRPKRHDEIG